MSDLYTDPIGTAELAATKIAALTGKARHHVALVMGSGWIDAADNLGTPTHEFETDDKHSSCRKPQQRKIFPF